MIKPMDFGNFVVIALTIVLFVVALFAQGITKDLLLEAGILLVSIKLIMFNYKQSLFDREVISRLDAIQKDLSALKK
jgi:hypothetical protein